MNRQNHQIFINVLNQFAMTASLGLLPSLLQGSIIAEVFDGQCWSGHRDNDRNG